MQKLTPENYPYYGENTLSKKKLQLRENYGSYPSILQCAPRVLAHTLVFKGTDGVDKTAKWSHLIELYEEETKTRLNNKGTRGLSLLNSVAVRPKPIERQKVSTCLKVFSDETYTASLSQQPGRCEGNCGVHP